MATKEEALFFLSKAVLLEEKEIIEALNALMDKATGFHAKDVLRSLRDEAKLHKQTFELFQKEISAGEKNEY